MSLAILALAADRVKEGALGVDIREQHETRDMPAVLGEATLGLEEREHFAALLQFVAERVNSLV